MLGRDFTLLLAPNSVDMTIAVQQGSTRTSLSRLEIVTQARPILGRRNFVLREVACHS
jgi:hypothetical protein